MHMASDVYLYANSDEQACQPSSGCSSSPSPSGKSAQGLFTHKYPKWTTSRVPMTLSTLWMMLVVLIPVTYFVGLALVPKQEGKGREGKQKLRGGTLSLRWEEHGGDCASGS